MDRRRRYLPALAFAAVVLVASLVPVPEGGGQALPALFGVPLDKWAHAGSYALLTGLLAWGRRRRTISAVGALVAIAIVYGAGIELAQSLVPTRSPSVVDCLANAAGAVIAGAAWLALARKTG